MWAFIRDVKQASPIAKREASRELAVTVGTALSVFFIGPLVFAFLIVPVKGSADGLFQAFSGSEVYIAAVSLLSIAIYSISKEYNFEGRNYLGFPHSVTILLSAITVLIVSFSVCTAHVVYDVLKPTLLWRSVAASGLGWILFVVTSAFAYGVLVLRYDMERGGPYRTHQGEEEFVQAFDAAREEAVP